MKSCASSANLLAFICGPPWAWIDWSAVFAELDIEHRLTRVRGENGGDLRGRPHGRDRLPREHELSDVDRNALHPGDQHMIPAPGIEDQELSIAAEGPGIDHPAVTRRRDLGAGLTYKQNALLAPAEPVGTAEIPDLVTVNRKRQETLGRGEGHRGGGPGTILESARAGLGAGGRVCSRLGLGLLGGLSRLLGRFGRALQILLHLGDQPLEIANLS